ncbi:MAG: aminotransferase class IV [Alphaproteobacteria bacterium]
MGRIAYVNGRYLPHGEASVHIEDRGYQFADGVYEVCAIRDGALLDEEAHWRRLWRSLNELAIARPLTPEALKLIARELVRKNKVRDGLLYLQITRGVAPRDHVFPEGVRPSIVMTVKWHDSAKNDARAAAGVAVRSFPTRWKRCDIKTVALLPNILAKQAASAAGALRGAPHRRGRACHRRGLLQYGSLTPERRLVTRHLDSAIPAGVTRGAVLALAGCAKGLRRGAGLQPGRGQEGPRGLSHQCERPRDPDRRDRRAPVGNGHPGVSPGPPGGLFHLSRRVPGAAVPSPSRRSKKVVFPRSRASYSEALRLSGPAAPATFAEFVWNRYNRSTNKRGKSHGCRKSPEPPGHVPQQCPQEPHVLDDLSG